MKDLYIAYIYILYYPNYSGMANEPVFCDENMHVMFICHITSSAVELVRDVLGHPLLTP